MLSMETVVRAARMPALYTNVGAAYRNRFRSYAESDIEVSYHLRNGLDLVAARGPHDLKIINEIWLDRDYAAPGFTPQAGWTILDLGANKGFFATWALVTAPGSHVHCYEPDPRNARCLQQNVRAFGKGATAHNVAVGSAPGELTLFRIGGRAGQGSVYRSRAESRGEIVAEVPVPVVALAELLAPFGRVDLMKIDVEGAEYDILLDSSTTALANVDRIVMEADDVDPGNSGRRLTDLLAGLAERGFELVDQRRTVHFLSRMSRP